MSKPHDECLPMDELDAIQQELEILLSSVALRYRALKTEHDYLEDRKHQKKSEKEKVSSPSTSKRKRDEKKSSSKDSSRNKHSKIKNNNNNSSYSPIQSHHNESSSADTSFSTSHLPAVTQTTAHHNKISLPKNDVPNKFWLSVEPYCMPITQEDIKMLDDLLDEYTEPLVPSIPELGPYYAVRWAADDLHDEQDSSNTKHTKRSTNTTTTTTNNDSMKKIGDKNISEGIAGPLTQRLVAALLEENDLQSDVSKDSSDSCENQSSTANRTQATAIASLLKNGIDVEKRLKKELFDLGIFDSTDVAKDKDDEILNEIKRVRTELKAIADFNRNELKVLRAAAKGEMKRLDIKRKLDRIDQEVINASI